MRGLRSPRWRMLAVLAASALIATACSSDDSTDEPDEGTGTATETTTDDTGTEDDGSAGGSTESFTYTTGIFEDTTTDNMWAYLDPDNSVWNAYVLNPTKASLYDIDYPDIVLAPELAADEEPPTPEQDGENYTVTVNLKEGATWSDGEPLTAEDVVFTFETVRDLGLGGNWLANANWVTEDNPEGLTEIAAPDETTVVFTFNVEPGLGVWPHNIGTQIPIMPQHFWEETVEEAKGTEDPATTLYEASGSGEPSSGPTIFQEREAGAFARVSANPDYIRSGETVEYESLGGGSYELGPYFEEEVFSLYGGQDPAVLALREGEVDYLYNSLGMQRGLRDQVIDDENLTAISNPSNGMRYLAFNLRKEPMNDKAFRKALATMIDRDFMATNVLQGVAFPLWTATPQANTKWYDEEAAAEIAAPYQDFESQEERFEAAVEILREAGYTWESEPALEIDDGGTPDDESDDVPTIIPGEGIMMPNGEPMPELELLAPGPGYDPLRSTYSVWIQQWAEQLGIPLAANPTNFNVIVSKVFPAQGEPEFDLYILGWSLGNPAFPTFYESFWHSRHDTAVSGGQNTPGFQNEEYDAAADAFVSATTEEEAYDILWNQIEPILAEELPYVFLFDTPILEFYRQANIAYPYTQMLGGIQYQEGMTTQVRAAQ